MKFFINIIKILNLLRQFWGEKFPEWNIFDSKAFSSQKGHFFSNGIFRVKSKFNFRNKSAKLILRRLIWVIEVSKVASIRTKFCYHKLRGLIFIFFFWLDIFEWLFRLIFADNSLHGRCHWALIGLASPSMLTFAYYTIY